MLFRVLSLERARPLRFEQRVTLLGGGISHLTWLSAPDEAGQAVRGEPRVFLVGRESS